MNKKLEGLRDRLWAIKEEAEHELEVIKDAREEMPEHGAARGRATDRIILLRSALQSIQEAHDHMDAASGWGGA